MHTFHPSRFGSDVFSQVVYLQLGFFFSFFYGFGLISMVVGIVVYQKRFF